MQRATPEVLAAWTALLAAHRRATTSLDHELRDRAGMSLDQYDVLYQLRTAGEPVRMSELADRLLVSRPTASRVVDRLVDHGLVRRWHDQADRRVVRLALTAEGRRAQSRAARIHVDGIARLVGGPLAGSDVGALTAALEAVAGR